MGWFGSVELGGTNCKVGVGDGSGRLVAQGAFSTGNDPVSTVGAIAAWFGEHGRELDAVGVASFGPLDLGNGAIAATPKRGWRGFPLCRELSEALHVRVALDTDVNGAALAEWTWGAARGFDDVLYVTIGTGIGVGAVVAGRLVRGERHPEMGHMRIPQRRDDPWSGDCDFHGTCWEGLASGHALSSRYGVPAAEISDEAAWRLETEYLALGVTNLICLYRPQRIVIGGGVLHHPGLLDGIRSEAADLLNSAYFPEAATLPALLVPPGLGDDSGLVGGLILASAPSR
jgi:fructokinase